MNAEQFVDELGVFARRTSAMVQAVERGEAGAGQEALDALGALYATTTLVLNHARRQLPPALTPRLDALHAELVAEIAQARAAVLARN